MAAVTGQRRAVGVAVLGSTAGVLPAFLTGAVAVQIGQDVDLGGLGLGLGIGAFYLSASVGSVPLGRVAERIGPALAVRLGLAATVAIQVALALTVRSAWGLGVLLFLAGICQALVQPAVNSLVAGRLPADRLGFALALKQSGMPLASLLGGIAVPALALTLGWQYAYAAGALIALATLAAVPADLPVTRVPGARAGRPDQPTSILNRYGVVGLLGAASAGILVTFVVSGAEASGIAPGPAGLLLTGGSALGIASRLAHGRLADRGALLPIRRVIVLLAVGAVGYVAMWPQTPLGYGLAVVPVFAFGWSWPGLFNLSVVRRNPSAPAAATGVSQTGVYIGAGAGPVLGGLVVDAAGYGALWVVCTGLLAAASVLAWRLRVALLADDAVRSAQPATAG